MSTADDFPYSVAQQKVMISADLNSTLLYQFLFGIYTGVFPATMYIYVHKENRTRARDMIIVGSITALYFATALNIAMNWLYTNIVYGTNGATSVEMFVESVNGDMPLGQEIIIEVTSFVVFLFADGLLVWRCFHSCGRLLRRSLLPIGLLTVETVLALTAIGYNCLLYSKPDLETTRTIPVYNRLSAAAFVAAAATSLVSTGVICLQIWRQPTLSSRSRKHYQVIINALIESSATYTVAVLFLAILNFTLNGNFKSSFTATFISKFVDGAAQIIAGLAPTLMIARLFVPSGKEDTEVSSARLPSDLVSRASHATAVANMTNAGADLEIQQSGSVGVGEQESEETQVINGNDYGLEDGAENRLEAIT